MKNRGALWTVSPVAVWMSFFLLLPLVIVFAVSLLSKGLYGGIEYRFTIDNYLRFFDRLYFQILLDSASIASITTLICLTFGYPFAYLVAKSPKKYQSLLLLLIIIPFWTNSLIRTYAWIILLRTEGAINTLLLKIGLLTEPLTFLYHDGAVMVGLVYTLFPFMVLPLYASIEKLNPSYLEASSDLGAKPWQSFFFVILPLTIPGIAAGCLLVFIPTLGLFFIPDIMGGAKTVLIGNLIKNQFLVTRDWPFGSAVSIILMLVTIGFVVVYLKIIGSKRE